MPKPNKLKIAIKQLEDKIEKNKQGIKWLEAELEDLRKLDKGEG